MGIAMAVPQTKRKWNGSKWIGKVRRYAIYRRDEFRCAYCGKDLESVDPQERTLDHITPKELGGSDLSRNLITSCRTCNSRKRDLSLTKFLSWLEDRGVEVSEIAKRIRRQRRRKWKLYR